jgi:hypothetical protein
MYVFGSGVVTVTRTDVANATPLNIGLVQEVAVDFTKSLKPLFGQYSMPIAVGEGTTRITGNAKVARMSARVLADLLYGSTLGTGGNTEAVGEAGVIPGTPFSITVANGATWVSDQGVVYATTGLPLKRVASGPTAGQYSVAAGGVYTFAAADTTLPVLISYVYGVTGVGQSFSLTNPLLGSGPTFGLVLYMGWGTAYATLELYACKAGKFGMGTKLEDWTIPQIDFEAFANAGNVVGKWSFPDTF